jgi:hypothetical protein
METAFSAPRLNLKAILRWPSLSAKRWSLSALGELALDRNTRAIIAIGSAVRPLHHRKSDVDFLFVGNAGPERNGDRPMDVDLRVCLPNEVDRKIRECDDLLGWALRFGRVVFDRDEYWSKLCSQWRARLPFPSPDSSVALGFRYQKFARGMIEVGDFDAALDQVVGMLTHRSRAALIRARIYPASRPELPDQLRGIGEHALALSLEIALQQRRIEPNILEELSSAAASLP